MKKAVKIAHVKTQPYVPTASGIQRIDNPVYRSKCPGLCVDYETRELCLDATMRIPLENVNWFELEGESQLQTSGKGRLVEFEEARQSKRVWTPERRAKYEAAKAAKSS